MTFTKNTTEILEALTLKVRVMKSDQIASAWFDDDVGKAREELEPLCETGLLERKVIQAHPMVDLWEESEESGQREPAAKWVPGDPEPTAKDLEDLAEFFQSRWDQADEEYEVFVATKRASNLMGSHIGPPSGDQWTHDLHVAEIFVELKKDLSPEDMRSVIGEGALPKLGKEIWRMKDPDLFLVDEHGQAELVIEFAGAYDKEHLRELHDHCSGGAYQKMKKRFPGRRHRLYSTPQGTEYHLL